MASSTELLINKNKAEHIRSAIEELLFVRSLIRKYTPDYLITNEQDKKELIRLIKKTGKYLIPIFEEVGLCGTNVPTASMDNQNENKTSQNLLETGISILQTVSENYIFISANSIKKKLKALGIEANKVIVAGGPMHIDDLKEMNPNIPENAIKGYEKKIENIRGELKAAFQTGKMIFFAMSPQDETDKKIAQRIKEIEQTLNVKFEIILIKSWDKI